eukprot:scaffold22125_cov70-Phaeocystis_antarctica.AAC.1
MHEIAIYVVPYLFALSIGTLLMAMARGVLLPVVDIIQDIYGSWAMTPARILLRIAANVIVIT